jgi:plastocyanin
MKQKKSRALAAATPLAALALLVALVVPNLATAESTAPVPGEAVTTIEIKMEGKKMGFFGPSTVHEGEELRIVNTTKPSMVGPHTFSLVTKGSLPKTAKARKSCFSPGHICLSIAEWQHFNLKTEKVGLQLAEAGPEGWSTMGSVSKEGDSWFSGEKPGGEIEQKVTAKAGTTLYYMCAIHPWMQGSIKVLPSVVY